MALSASELSAMRSAQQAVLPDRCTILRPTYTVSAVGDPEEAFGTVATSVPCRLAWAAPKARVELEGERFVDTWAMVLTLPFGQDIQAGDRVEVAGETFEVIAVHPPSAWQTAVRCEVVRV